MPKNGQKAEHALSLKLDSYVFSLEGFQPNFAYCIWIVLALLMSVRAARTYGGLAGVTLSWISFSALRVFATPTSPYVHEQEIWNASLSLSAASAWIGIVLACSAIQGISLRSWLWFWNVIAIVNAFAIIIGAIFGQPCGLLFNASMSGCMSAVLFPLFFDSKGRVPILSAIIVPLSVLVTCKNQPIALLFLSVGIVLIRSRRFKELFLAIGASVLTGGFLIGHMFGNDEGRLEVWKLAFQFFRDNANPYIGTGLGTFYYIGPWLTLKPFGQGFLWLHSDWFQILFESGSIGLALVALLFLQAVFNARRNTALCTSLLCFGAWALANFPLHNPVSALLGAFLIHAALATAPKDTRTPDPHSQA